MKRVIFLDIDGVLVCRNYIDSVSNWDELTESQQLDPSCIACLNQITDLTRANLVISSTWRIFYPMSDLKLIFNQAGITGNILDITPINELSRGEQIQEWLNNHCTESFTIIDDDSDMGSLIPYLIKTNYNRGLEDFHITQAISALTLPHRITEQNAAV